MKPEKDKEVPLLGHMTVCRPACPFLGHSYRSKVRFSSMAMEYLQNIMFPQGERKYQARFHSKAPTDLANNMFNSVLNLNCEQSTKP